MAKRVLYRIVVLDARGNQYCAPVGSCRDTVTQIHMKLDALRPRIIQFVKKNVKQVTRLDSAFRFESTRLFDAMKRERRGADNAVEVPPPKPKRKRKKKKRGKKRGKVTTTARRTTTKAHAPAVIDAAPDRRWLGALVFGYIACIGFWTEHAVWTAFAALFRPRPPTLYAPPELYASPRVPLHVTKRQFDLYRQKEQALFAREGPSEGLSDLLRWSVNEGRRRFGCWSAVCIRDSRVCVCRGCTSRALGRMISARPRCVAVLRGEHFLFSEYSLRRVGFP